VVDPLTRFDVARRTAVEHVELTQIAQEHQQLVRLVGDIDMMTSGEMIEKLADAASAITPPQIAVLDLSGVGFLSALGARALCTFNRACALRGVCTYWVAPTGSGTRHIIDLLGFSDAIPIFDTIEQTRQRNAAPAAPRSPVNF
jgi:anti-anti-sigma factor